MIRSWFAAAPFSTQRTMSSQRGDNLRASNILHNQDQHHPSLIRNVIERVSHCLPIHIYIYVCVCLIVIFAIIRLYSYRKHNTPHKSDAYGTFSEEMAEIPNAHLVDRGDNYTPSSSANDVRNDNPVVKPTTCTISTSKINEEVCMHRL